MAGRTFFDMDSSDEENEDVWDAHQVPLPPEISFLERLSLR